jgi:hypothetical protein
MFKPTPNPPETDISHLRSSPERGMSLFTVAPDANTEAIAIQAYETFSSVSILLLDLADSLEDTPRHLAMAIYQLSELGLLLVEKSLEREQAIATT